LLGTRKKRKILTALLTKLQACDMVGLGMTGIDTPLYGELLVRDGWHSPKPERSYAAAVNGEGSDPMKY